jgi:hypothetical protein
MSGGSFDYVCFKLTDGRVVQALPMLREMEIYLRAMRKHEAADELLLGIMRIETASRRLDVVGKHLYALAYAAEWWNSGDWDEDQFDKEFQEKYLGGES